jgi:DNA processing protein
VLETQLHYWLALKLVPRLAIHKKLQLVKTLGITGLFQTQQALSSFGLSVKQISAITCPDWKKISQIIEASELCQSNIITFDDHRYPVLLKEIYDPPLVLFTQGNDALLVENQLAIVGSRHASINGKESALAIAQQLVQQKIVITSGLALGIDAAAHKGALKGGGKTIAVVATGLDIVYPARHKLLAKEIIANDGLILSEFTPGTPPKAGHFPKRNRLISGLSKGTLVVEAAMKSGSLITARSAMEQNREVFAVPGSIHNPQTKGCHWLIKQGAKLVEGAADIVEELDLPRHIGLNLSTAIAKFNEREENFTEDLNSDPLLASVGYEITPIDMVVSRSKLSTDVVLTRLTMLELKGLVSAVPGGYLRLNRG